MGQNSDGQLGDGTLNNTNRPERILASGVTAIAGGGGHCLFVKSDGSLWVMGLNNCGQLGDGTYNNTNKPEEILASGVTAIAAGEAYSLFVEADGSLWATGQNVFGQLGDGTYNNTNQPQEIVGSGVVAIACGDFHSLFLKSDGSLWAMGWNNYGQLGDGTYNETNQPEQIFTNVTTIACGGEHSLFLTSGGSLWAMGLDDEGELGDGYHYPMTVSSPVEVVSNGVIAIAGGDYHSLFLKSDGSLWGMGLNTDGELGDGTYGGEWYYTNRPEETVTSNVIAIASGQFFSLFLKSDGSLWGMGDDSDGELGDGFPSSSWPTPEQIVPTPQPILSVSIVTKTNLQINGTCLFGGTFYLLSNTNVTQPMNQWERVWTNEVSIRTNNNFNAILTNSLGSFVGKQFYILQSQ